MSESAGAAASSPPELPPAGMRWIAAGTFLMGAEQSYPEEAPVHTVTVSGFWMDKHTVTNAEFAAFVAATGYKTVAERPLDPAMYPGAQPELLKPGAAVFFMPTGRVNMNNIHSRWAYVPGASWRHPEGPDSAIEGREQEPVVQVAFEDAAAYAAWAGKDLPTEAEWEFAARGGLDEAVFCWGNEFRPDGLYMANTWQGQFPFQDLGVDGFIGRAPVGSFPSNGYGLYDMAGNVWEWTTDWYSARHPDEPESPCCVPRNPRGGAEALSYDPMQPEIRIPRKVIKGGSYLCAPNYCRRYRPAARHPQMIDTATCHIGFRCIIRTNANLGGQRHELPGASAAVGTVVGATAASANTANAYNAGVAAGTAARSCAARNFRRAALRLRIPAELRATLLLLLRRRWLLAEALLWRKWCLLHGGCSSLEGR